jgi:chorismate synthase
MHNSFGKIFSVTTWGESHGPAVGCVVDGCPAGLELAAADIQEALDRRRPGQSRLTTPRAESDAVEILSGVFGGKTTGTPISLLVRNTDQRSHDYSDMESWYRPGHADRAYDLKYGFRDYRGGGRASARETIGRVAAGAVAAKLLRRQGVEILAFVCEIAGIPCGAVDAGALLREQIEASPVRCPDLEASSRMEAAILEAKKNQDSVGGVVRLVARHVPAGLGEPVFGKIEALLAQAMLSIPAVKGFEMGEGFAAAKMLGSVHNQKSGGGAFGGITDGSDLDCRIAFKPTPTIAQVQRALNKDGSWGDFAAKGRHDPCVAVRAPVIVESMAALVLADLWLLQGRMKA